MRIDPRLIGTAIVLFGLPFFPVMAIVIIIVLILFFTGKIK